MNKIVQSILVAILVAVVTIVVLIFAMDVSEVYMSVIAIDLGLAFGLARYIFLNTRDRYSRKNPQRDGIWTGFLLMVLFYAAYFGVESLTSIDKSDHMAAILLVVSTGFAGWAIGRGVQQSMQDD